MAPDQSDTPAARDCRTAMGASSSAGKTPLARVLLADDDGSSRYVVAMILKGMGCRVDAVADGAEAVEAASRRLYDLILLDGMMPIMNGIEAARAIRQMRNDSKRVPIVGITGNPVQITREDCLQAGMNEYLQKPLGRDAYKQIVERWVLRPAAGASSSRSGSDGAASIGEPGSRPAAGLTSNERPRE